MLTNFQKFYISVFTTLFLVPLVTFAVEFKPLVADNPFVVGSGEGLAGFLDNLYKIGISVASVLAIIMIFYSGFVYTTSTSSSGKSAAKQRIQAAIGGLLLALGSYIILRTINPQLVAINLGFDRVNRAQITAEIVTAEGRAALAEQARVANELEASYEQAMSSSTTQGNNLAQPVYVLGPGGNTGFYSPGTEATYIPSGGADSLKGIPLKGDSYKAGINRTETLMTPVRIGNVLAAKGTGSVFGGASDSAGINEYGNQLAPIQGSGLKFSSLNPESRYVALRFNYQTASAASLKNSCVVIINPRTGDRTTATPVDWGPNQSTGKSIDMSPGAARKLGSIYKNNPSAVTGQEFIFYITSSPCSGNLPLFI